MSNQGAMHISDADFEKTIKEAGMPVMLDFYADWCGPCKMAAPIIDQLAEEYKDKILVTKMNIDQNRETPGKYGVMSIPTVMIFAFEDGEIVEKAKQTGFAGKEGFEQMIKQVL